MWKVCCGGAPLLIPPFRCLRRGVEVEPKEEQLCVEGPVVPGFFVYPSPPSVQSRRGRREAAVCKGVCCSGLPDHPFPPPLAQSGGGRGNSRVPGACFSAEQAGHLRPGRKNL